MLGVLLLKEICQRAYIKSLNKMESDKKDLCMAWVHLFARNVIHFCHIGNIKNTHCLGMSHNVNFLGGLGCNEFHLK